MSTVPLNKKHGISGLAERCAADVSHGREQLGAGREALERYRNSELAEAEALALARIKADTQRALAHQAQTLRDAERTVELVAIKRRSIEIEATREAQRREALDKETARAIHAKTEANILAEQAAEEKKNALVSAHQARQARLLAERDALAAQRRNHRTRIGLVWITVRNTSPLKAGLVALLIGATGGWLLTELRSTAQHSYLTEEAPLKLETELSVLPIKSRAEATMN